MHRHCGVGENQVQERTKTMYRRDVLMGLAAAVSLSPTMAFGQTKSLREQLHATWYLLLVDGKKADGTQTPLFGPNPIGSLIFTPEGRFSVQIMRTVNRPLF